MRSLTLDTSEAEALHAALDNEIETWEGADCGEHSAENNAWVTTLKNIKSRIDA